MCNEIGGTVMSNYVVRTYSEDARVANIQRPSATFEQIAHAMHDISLKVRLAAISHPKVDEDHLELAFEIGCPELLKKAVAHPLATLEHLKRYVLETKR
jgi:hydrogenase/urease accessory protein HupE